LVLASGACYIGMIRWPKPKLGPKLEPHARVAHPELDEASGMVQSAGHPDILWVHNDSGDVPRLFAINLAGDVIMPASLANEGYVTGTPGPGQRLYPGISIANSRLVDWEDITRHGDRLYIAEMGNNLNRRRDLGVYEVVEPDPRQTLTAEATAFIPVRYAQQTSYPPSDSWDYDCEAIFWWGEHLYFVTKTRPAYRPYVQGAHADLHRLDSMDPNQENILTFVDHAKDLGGWVTSAETSDDGRYLAVLVESPVQSVWLFERPAQGDRFFTDAVSVRRRVFHGAGQIEAVAFYRGPDGHDEILILNEQRALFRLRIADFQAVNEQRK
jgi:hypothetical protein